MRQNLPNHIKEYFFKTLKGEISLVEFEKWVYEMDELEQVLSFNDYLDLISLNYKRSGARLDLFHILERQIDLGEFETYKLMEILNEAKARTENLPQILVELYDLYCKGYSFLRPIALNYGIAMLYADQVTYDKMYLYEVSAEETKIVVDSMFPNLATEFDRVIDLIESRKIVLTGELNEMYRHQYIDLRTEEDEL